MEKGDEKTYPKQKNQFNLWNLEFQSIKSLWRRKVYSNFYVNFSIWRIKKSDQNLIYYVKTHTDDPQWFPLRVDINLRKECRIKFCVKLIRVIYLDDYYSQFRGLSRKLVQ
jgi:hypothetical protein